MKELRKKVQKNRMVITREVRYVDIQDYLKQELFLVDDDEEIMACATNRERMTKCLDLLRYRRGSRDPYEVFLNSLTDAYSNIKDMIENTEVEEIQTNEGGDWDATKDQEEIDFKTMLKLSKDAAVMKNWKMLARVLELEEADILEIENRHEKSLQECVYQVLSEWKAHHHRGQTTKGRLKEALLSLGLQEVIDKVFES